SLLLLWCLVRSGDSVARWLVAGMLFTLAVLARESALLFGPFVALWMVQRFRAQPRLLGRVALAFVAGCAAGFAPLVARNVALGVLGLWLDRRNAGRHRLLWYFLLAAVGGLMYGTIVGRYRLAMTAVLILYAAVAVDWLARELAARRWRAAVPAVLAAIALGILSAHLLPSAERLQRYRPDEFHIAARSYYDGGDPARAFDELASGLETAPTGPDQPTLPPRY